MNTSAHGIRDEIIERLQDKLLLINDVASIYYAHRDDKEIVGHVAMNLSLRTSVFDRDKEYSVEMVELLSDLATNQVDMGARWAVAKNPHTSVDTLTLLSKDDINLVRALVSCNPSTPQATLDMLFNDEKIVRDGLSGNPSTSLKLLQVLCDDSDKMVRLRLAENPSASENILKRLSSDLDVNVAKAARLHLEKFTS